MSPFFLAGLLLAAPQTHVRPQQVEVRGRRVTLPRGVLYLPPRLKLRPGMPLVVHFHGAQWVSEWNLWRSGKKTALVSVHIGAGSRVYRQPFADPDQFARLLESVEQAVGRKVGKLLLTSFSAGYGAIAEILTQPRWRERVSGVLLADSLHCSYVPEGRPGALNIEQLRPFAAYARRAAEGSVQIWLTHSQIAPGNYASTTETADYLIAQAGARRRPARRTERGMRQLWRADRGGFHLRGFAGHTARDHMDHFFAMGDWLRKFRL